MPTLTIDPKGVVVSVAVTNIAGNAPAVYSDSTYQSAVNLPVSISATTTYYLPESGPVRVVCTDREGTTLTDETVVVGPAVSPMVDVVVPADHLAKLANLRPAANSIPARVGSAAVSSLTLAEGTVLGRAAGGDVAALTAAQAKTMLDVNRPNRAPKTTAPLLSVTPLTKTVTTKALNGYNPATGIFYATNLSNGQYCTSTNLSTWTDTPYSPSVYTPGLIGWQFDATYMYACCTTGKVWRAVLGLFNAWTEVSVSSRPAGTTGLPGSLCALGAGRLLYGNYNGTSDEGAHIWLSTDAGATWTEVLSVATGRHVHAIRKSPATGYVYASVGDAGYAGKGLYRSTDNGSTWVHVSSNDYGIDMVFVDSAFGSIVVLEGDGLNRPLLMGWHEDGAAGDKTFPLVWFTGAPADNASTRGTARGLIKTPAGDLMFFTTTESGAVGTRAGLWIAAAPDYTSATLLYETTGAEPVAQLASGISGSTFHNYAWQFPVPSFGTY